jgi:sporulation-control protein spo0M
MVLGIGEGSIDIVVDRVTVSRGDTIKGKVVLNLKKARKARGLKIRLVADRIAERSDRAERDAIETIVVYSKEVMLGPEQKYAAGESEYKFEFVVPDLEPPRPNELRIGPLSLQVGKGSPLSWRLDAFLDLPLALDIKKTVTINVI